MSEKKASLSYKKSAALVTGKNFPKLKLNVVEKNQMQLYSIDDFLSPTECEQIVALSQPRFEYSTTEGYLEDLGFRTSKTCHLYKLDNPFIKSIEDKIAKCMGIRLPYSEDIQVQKYEIQEEYKAHRDYFNLTDVSKGGQRTWTFMVYLTEVAKGGGTKFVDLDVTISPKLGRAVIWNNLHINGEPNRSTVHQGLPVEEGTKIIITKWFRDRGVGKAWY